MTIANNYAPIVMAANGTTTVFSGSWNAIAAANLVVQLLNTTTGVYTTVSQGTGSNEYQVTSLISSGFVITFNTAPAAGNNVVISRDTQPTQTVPYTTSRGFQGTVEEGSFDAITAMIQELNDRVVNSVQVSVGDTAENLILPIASLRANSVLAFDASGNVIAISNPSVSPNPVFNSITTPTVIGGVTGSSTLTLKSTSAAANSGNTDAILLETSNSLAPTSPAISSSYSSPVFTEIDNMGRHIIIVGQPSTSLLNGTYNANNPLNVPIQPIGTDASFVMCGTYTHNEPANMMTLTVYSNTSGNGSGTYALNATGVACSASAGVGGISGVGVANVTGAVAFGLQGTCSPSAPGTFTVACLLESAGDNVNASEAFLWMQSQSAANSPANMIQIKDGNNNPVQSSGSIICTEGGNNLSCAYGIKLDNATFSTAFLLSKGFKVDGNGNTTLSNTTGAEYFGLSNTGNTNSRFGIESSTGGTIFTGSSAYATVIGSLGGNPVQFFTNNVLRGQFTGAGVFECAGTAFQVDTNGNVTANSITAPLVGVTTNSNAPAGDVGEYVTNNAGSVGLTNSTSANITSISLTAGDWDVWGAINFLPAGTTVATIYQAAISTTSATLPSAPTQGLSILWATMPAGSEQIIQSGVQRISVASTTTVYLVGNASFSVSTMSSSGIISARRRR